MKCPEVVGEQYWVTWAPYPKQGIPRGPIAISWTVGTSECFSSLMDVFPLKNNNNNKKPHHLLIMEIFKQKEFNEPLIIHHPASTMMKVHWSRIQQAHFWLCFPEKLSQVNQKAAQDRVGQQ